VSCLSRRDFIDFAAQLEGLAGIYQLNAEKKVKSKALVALLSLETDLTTLSNLQTSDAANMLRSSPVGVLYRRRGGNFQQYLRRIHSFVVLVHQEYPEKSEKTV